MSARLILVDESKASDYLLVAAAIVPGDAASCRGQLRKLLLPRQPRLHMKKESDALARVCDERAPAGDP